MMSDGRPGQEEGRTSGTSDSSPEKLLCGRRRGVWRGEGMSGPSIVLGRDYIATGEGGREGL